MRGRNNRYSPGLAILSAREIDRRCKESMTARCCLFLWCLLPALPWGTAAQSPARHETRADVVRQAVMEQRTAERLAEARTVFGPASAKVAANEADSLVLAAFFRATGGTDWVDNSRWLSGPVADWFGVTLDAAGRVTHLVLRENGLVGSLPDTLGQLAALEVLHVPGNGLSRAIPASLARLAMLKELSLWGNRLTGAIPPELGGLSELEQLLLYNNALAGPIPPELGRLQSLRRLWLDFNRLFGQIPPQLLDLAELTEFFVDGNNLSGSLPEGLPRLEKVISFFAGGNQIEGPVPVDLWQMPALENLSLAGNRHTGPVPEEMTDAAGLTRVLLSGNRFTGNVPAEVPRLRSLTTLDLSGNLLAGPIPESVGFVENLKFLNLSGNNLDGEIPSSLGNLAILVELDLADNQLEGALPGSLGRLSRMERIDLSRNRLSGELGALLGLQRLRQVRLRGNRFSGELPAAFAFMPALEVLDLGDNALEGSPEVLFGRRTSFAHVALDGNALGGTLPQTITLSSRLRTLRVQHNDIEDLPDLSGLPLLDSVNAARNRLTFEDIEPSLARPMAEFLYAPQDSVDTFLSRTDTHVRFHVAVGGSANMYRWFRNGELVQGATEQDLVIERSSDVAAYHCEITSSLVPGLVIASHPVDSDADPTGVEALPEVAGFAAHPNYPNPFAGHTTIAFRTANRTRVTITVYDALGRVVQVLQDGLLGPGSHAVRFDGSAMPAGLYLYRIVAGESEAKGSMVIYR